MATVPMVAAVATDEPEMAANMAHEPTFECMRPPGSHDSQCVAAAYMLSAMPERSMISPNRMNSGMATRMTSVEDTQPISPMARLRGRKE